MAKNAKKTATKPAPKKAPAGISALLGILALLTSLLAGVFYVVNQNIEQFYIFDTDHLHDLAKRSIAAHGNDTRAIVKYIVDELNEKVPQHVNLEEDWMFNNHGCAMGAMYIIHASITEYLIIYGTTIGTEGHSGRHTADDYFHILTGTELAYVPGEYESEVYPAGSVHVLRAGQVKQYKMLENSFALEYARGWIPPMLFFGFADTFTSTLDFLTLGKTVRITGREMIKNLLQGKL